MDIVLKKIFNPIRKFFKFWQRFLIFFISSFFLREVSSNPILSSIQCNIAQRINRQQIKQIMERIVTQQQYIDVRKSSRIVKQYTNEQLVKFLKFNQKAIDDGEGFILHIDQEGELNDLLKEFLEKNKDHITTGNIVVIDNDEMYNELLQTSKNFKFFEHESNFFDHNKINTVEEYKKFKENSKKVMELNRQKNKHLIGNTIESVKD